MDSIKWAQLKLIPQRNLIIVMSITTLLLISDQFIWESYKIVTYYLAINSKKKVIASWRSAKEFCLRFLVKLSLLLLF